MGDWQNQNKASESQNPDANKIEEKLSETQNISKHSQPTGEKLLGELLRRLREEQEMKFLMICREFSVLRVEGEKVVIFASDSITAELRDERLKKYLNNFFKEFGLIFEFDLKQDRQKAIEELNRLLGGNLQIK